MSIKDDFVMVPIPPIPNAEARSSALADRIGAPSPLGPLALLPGTWTGTGFNQIWRPFHGTPASQDRFLELNRTIETIQFSEIPGQIPNRGLLQNDIVLFGMTYLQQVQDANVKGANGKPAGIHIEPGIWLNVTQTTNPADGPSVARLANIPHGTSILAQGSATTVPHAPTFPVASITPFTIAVPPALPNFINFPETNLTTPSSFRSPPANLEGITQQMVDNPNLVLAAGIAGKHIVSTTQLQISTSTHVQPQPTSGGGTVNLAFLAGGPAGPNATSAEVDATFYLETIKDPSGALRHQLQYSQRVLLNFNGLSWPHVSVATLVKG